MQNYWKLVGIIGNCWNSLKIIEINLKLMKFIGNQWKSLELIEDHRDFFEINCFFGNYSKLLEIHAKLKRFIGNH